VVHQAEVSNLRYRCALSTPRPALARRLIGYSPKLQRRVTLYGRAAFEQWLLLETDPNVISFCERPALLKLPEGAKLADYWTCGCNREEAFLILGEDTPGEDVFIGETSIAVRRIAPAQLAASRQWTQNWERMLPVINAAIDSVSAPLTQDIAAFIRQSRSLMQIEREYALAAENLFLRRQLGLYTGRNVKARRPDRITRFALAYLSKFFNWRDALIIVRPRILIGWHRAGFRLLWRWKSKPGRPPISIELRRLIKRMAQDNPAKSVLPTNYCSSSVFAYRHAPSASTCPSARPAHRAVINDGLASYATTPKPSLPAIS
jgi:hypothetical protein